MVYCTLDFTPAIWYNSLYHFAICWGFFFTNPIVNNNRGVPPTYLYKRIITNPFIKKARYGKRGITVAGAI